MFTLAVLSWGAHKTLINTLNSYATFGLSPIAGQKLIFFQEISPKDREIAEHFGFEAIGDNHNIGIANGYRRLVNAASQPFFLFLENDWLLLERPENQIASGIYFLDYEAAEVVRYRSRKFPGNPLWSRQFEGREQEHPQHLLDSVHWKDDPSEFPQISKRSMKTSGDWFFTTAKYANWTNNPTMFRTDFLKAYILPRLGEGDIEKDLQDWWSQRNFLVAQGEGLFTHYRIG